MNKSLTMITRIDEISLKKREIEAKLEEEKASIQWLKESLQKSDNLANNMLNILTSFEDRLCKLEDTILPVHKETTDLQRRQENVDKTLILLDDVLSYHNVSSSLKPIIEEGPAGHLEDYLDSMVKIDQAIEFFLKNNPESIELSVLRSLNETAKDSLEKEFLLLLQRNSKPVPVVTIQDILNATIDNDDTISEFSMEDHIQHFSERVMDELKTIASWLTENRKGTDYMSIYSQIRSMILQQSLLGVKDEGFRFNFVDLLGKRKATVARHGTDVSNIKKKIIPRKSKQVIETSYHKRNPSSGLEALKDDDENSEVASFITCTGALLKLMQSELQLMQSIIPEERQIPIFSQLVQDTLGAYYGEALIICESACKVQGRLDHSAVQILLPILKYLRIVKPEFDSLLKLVNVDTRKKFLDVIVLISKTGKSILFEFASKLTENDKNATMPKDGTVHQVTSNVTIYLEELINYLDTTAFLLHHESPLTNPQIDDTYASQIVSEYFARILAALSLNLTNKSKMYDTSALQSIFVLNNYNYIVKSLHKIGIMKMLEEYGNPNLEREYDEAIEEEMKSYERSWFRVASYLGPDATDKAIETSGKQLKDKYKQAIKDKFKGFNTELEDIKHLHQQFHVPDTALKKRIFERINNMVVPKYTELLMRYRDVHFTKNVEKYIKYDVDRIRKIIAHIYDLKDPQQI